MSFEGILVRLLNRRTRPQRRKQSPGLHLGASEALITRDRAPFILPWSPAQHTFVSGRTGSGKTTLLLKILYEHVRCSVPFLFIDFHGSATDEILATIAGSSYARPVILLEPWSDRPIGWNQLELNGESPYPITAEQISRDRA